MIEFQHVTAGYGDKVIIKDVSLHIPKGKITTLIGPNGSGKTTLLRVAARQLALSQGSVSMDGKSVQQYSRNDFAKLAAFLPQVRIVPAINVKALVSHGRFPYLGLSRKMRPEDRDAVRQAMQQTGVDKWANRDLRSLSGGERQRVYLAMALAQQTPIIFLDEPTTYLDLHYQFEFLELLQELNYQGKTIVMVLHELSHALGYSDQIALLSQGELIQYGTADQLVQSKSIEQTFQIELQKIQSFYCFRAQTIAEHKKEQATV